MDEEILDFDFFDLLEGVRPAFGSPGGKKFLAKKIVGYIPDHKTYVEPFCLTGDSLIFTNPNFKMISDCKIGDKVLTHNGFAEIEKKYERKFTGNLLRVKVKGDYRELKITENHPVLAIKRDKFYEYIGQRKLTSEELLKLHKPFMGSRDKKERNRTGKSYTLQKMRHLFRNAEWIEAGKLKAGDFLVRFFDSSNLNLCKLKLPEVRERIDQYQKPHSLPINSEVMRMIGLFIAEGNLDRNRAIGFTNKNSVILNFLLNIFRQYFNCEGKIYSRDNGVKYLRFSSTQANQFLRQFGEKALNKFIPYRFKILPLGRQAGLIRGMFEGDGCRTEEGYIYATVSKELAQDLLELLFRQGCFPTFRKEVKKTILPSGRNAICTVYLISIYDGREKLARILKQQPFTKAKRHFLGRNLKGCGISNSLSALIRIIESVEKEKAENLPVFNFQVANANSYTTPIATVHNCGGAAVFFAKKPSEIEILNDKDSEIAFAYRFIKAGKFSGLDKLNWKANEIIFKNLKDSKPSNDLLRFHKFAYLVAFSRGDRQSYRHINDDSEFKLVERLPNISRRLTKVKIFNSDWKEMVKHYDSADTFFYFDPPYPGTSWVTVSTDLSNIVETLKKIKGKFILSWSPKSPKLPGFYLKTVEVRRGDQEHQMDKEILISNFPLKESSLWLAEAEFDPTQYQPQILIMLPTFDLVRLHKQLFDEWKARGSRSNDEEVINANLLLLDELKRRNVKFQTDNELDELSFFFLKGMILNEALKEGKYEDYAIETSKAIAELGPIVLVPDFVSWTGSLLWVENRQPHDLDVIIRDKDLPGGSGAYLKIKRIVNKFFGTEPHLTFDIQGPNWKYLPQWDLALIPKQRFEIQTINEPGFAKSLYEQVPRAVTSEIIAQAEKAKKADKITLGEFFYVMKPTYSTAPEKRQTIEALMDFIKNGETWMVEKKYD